MTRRAFITLLGTAAAWPLGAHAQQPARIPRIGFLGFGGAATWANRIAALQAGLSDLGYVEGKSIVTRFRSLCDNHVWCRIVVHGGFS